MRATGSRRPRRPTARARRAAGALLVVGRREPRLVHPAAAARAEDGGPGRLRLVAGRSGGPHGAERHARAVVEPRADRAGRGDPVPVRLAPAVPALPAAVHRHCAAVRAGRPGHPAELLVALHAAGAGGGLRRLDGRGRPARLEGEVEALLAVLEAQRPAVQRLVDGRLQPWQGEALEARIRRDADAALGERRHRLAAGEQHREGAPLAAGQTEPGQPVQAGLRVGEAEGHRVGERGARRGTGVLGLRVGQDRSLASTSTAVPSTS